jgi:ABC-2 type transport system permease protein
MLLQILSTTWKDLKILFKDTRGLATLFLMPLMFIVVMSTALQGVFGADSDTQPTLLPVVNLDRGHLAEDVVAQLNDIDGIQVETTWKGETLTRQRAEALVTGGARAVAVVFPADFSKQVEARLRHDDATATIELVTDPAVSTQFIAPIYGMVFGAAERVAQIEFNQERINYEVEDMLAEMPALARPDWDQIEIETDDDSIVQVERVAPPAMNVEVFPDSYQQNVPGYTVLGVFFIVGTMASSILQEKQDGTFRRLLVAPIPKPVLLAGKILPYYLVNLVQVVIMFSVAYLLFGMELVQPVALGLIGLALAAAATGLGVLVATVGRTNAQVGGLSMLLTLTLSALGGCMVPSFVMPGFMQTLSGLTPHYWAIQGFQDALVRGYGVGGVWPEAAALLGFAAAFFLLGVWRFRFE